MSTRRLTACVLSVGAWMLSGVALAQSAAEPSAAPAPAPHDEAQRAQPDCKPCARHRLEWLVLEGSLGYRALNMKRVEFGGQELSSARLVDENIGGFSPGIGLGVRLWIVRLMLRGDVTLLRGQGALDDSAMWNVDLEVDVRILQGPLQPYLLIGMGYSALGDIGAILDEVPLAFSANGVNLRGGVGLDWYLVPRFSLGLRLDVGAHVLASKITARELLEPVEVDTIGQTEARLAEADGSLLGFSYGAALTFALHLP